MKLSPKSLAALALMICGEFGPRERWNFPYRSSSYLTRFFRDLGLPHVHDGSTRRLWVEEVLEQESATIASNPSLPADSIVVVIQALLDARSLHEAEKDRSKAIDDINGVLRWDGFRVFVDADDLAQLEVVRSGVRSMISATVHRRAWTAEEKKLRASFESYLDTASEDEITERLLVPLFMQLGFQRISLSGHVDKRLEYGTDLWMKYPLPTRHCLYFGCQIKKEKIDASARSESSVGTILNQITMMLENEIWDPELNRKQLLDHIYIISGGEITKQARNWLGQRLDATKRRHIMFMDRPELLDLFVLNRMPVPKSDDQEDLPF